MSKKEELLLMAAEIIQNEGIQALSMDYLAQKADITKGGVLYHFESKGNLLLKMNQMVIDNFDEKVEKHQRGMTGNYQFTRAYALATLDYLNQDQQSFLPAVFIVSYADEDSLDLWQHFSGQWNDSFLADMGDRAKIMKLRLLADGIWFHVLYYRDDVNKREIEKVIHEECRILSKEGS